MRPNTYPHLALRRGREQKTQIRDNMKEKRERNAEKKRYTPILRVGVDENVAGMKIAVDEVVREAHV